MNNSIFAPDTFSEITERINKLSPSSQAKWGKMNVAQMLGHCANAINTSVSDDKGKVTFMGRIFGKMARKMVLADDKPFKQNLPTAKEFIVTDERNFERERRKLLSILELLKDKGPNGVADKVHPFFGTMAKEDWAFLIYKHLDHHLRQFGV